MPLKPLTQRGLVATTLVLFLGGGVTTASHYWLQQYDYVAKVNGKPIRTAEYQRHLLQAQQMFAGAQAAEAVIEQLTLNQLIDREIFLHAAEQQNLSVTPEAVEQEWQSLLQMQYNNDSERMLRVLRSMRYSEAGFRRELQQRLRVRQLQTKLTEKLQLSEAELRQYYQDNLQDYQLPERIEVQHILLHLDEKDPDSARKVEQEARDLLSQIQQGKDFGVLAAQHSDDSSSKEQGGKLAPFAKGDMVEAFEKAAWPLQPGQVYPRPVQTEFGWHLIKRGRNLPAGPRPFEEARSIFEARLLEQKKQEFLQTWLAEQRQQHKISIHARYQPEAAPAAPPGQAETGESPPKSTEAN